VFDVQGRQVESFSKVQPKEILNLKVESGIYFIKIQEYNSVQTLKLVVE